MNEMTATVKNTDGIHLRPSHMILEVAADYPGQIRVESANGQTDLRSIMGLMLLALGQGTQVKIGVEGPDEDLFCQKLVDLFETNFDFRGHDRDVADPGHASPRMVSSPTRGTRKLSNS